MLKWIPTIGGGWMAGKLKLSDMAIRAAKPRDRAYKLSDGGGLHLFITPHGARLWRLQYRFAGKQRMVAFGPYCGKGREGLSLGQARAKAVEAREILRANQDPATKKKLDKIATRAAHENTFRVVAAEFLQKIEREGLSATTVEKVGWLIGIANKKLGDRPVAEIEPAEILAVLRGMERRGRLDSTQRLRATISRVFRYAVATARAKSDPAALLVGATTAPTVTSYPAITDPVKFGALLRAIESFDGQPQTKAALQLMSLMFPRPGELRRAAWSEFDFEKAVWTIPASRMKMRKEHRVPLSRQVIEILQRLREITGDGKFVFPSVRSAAQPISEGTMIAALRRLGYAKNEAVPHGFRSSASTMLNEAGYDPDVIEAALAHADKNSVRRIYNRAEYWTARVKLYQEWADRIDAMRNGAEIITGRFEKTARDSTSGA